MMKEQKERIEELLARYFSAQTTRAEERVLRAWFRQANELPEELRYAQTLFRGLEALARERMPAAPVIPLGSEDTGECSGAVSRREKAPGATASGRNRFRTQPLSRRFPAAGVLRGPVPDRMRRLLRWSAGIAAALVLGIVLVAELLRKPYCYIDGVAVYDKRTALQTTAYLDGFSRLDDPVRMVDELIEHTK